MEEALLAFYLADPLIVAEVGDRIAWDLLPQGDALPALGLTTIAATRGQTFRGRSGLVNSLIQFDCWGDTKIKALALKRLVVRRTGALTAPPFTVAFVEDEASSAEAIPGPRKSGSSDVYRTSLDVRVWHHEHI